MSRPKILGFSLIEVTIAVAIIGLMIMVTGTLLQRITVYARETSHQALAIKIAHNEMEVLRAAGYASLPASGSFTDSLLASLPSGAGTVTVTDFDPKTKRLVVTVSWFGSQSTPRSTSLTTLITQNSSLK